MKDVAVDLAHEYLMLSSQREGLVTFPEFRSRVLLNIHKPPYHRLLRLRN